MTKEFKDKLKWIRPIKYIGKEESHGIDNIPIKICPE